MLIWVGEAGHEPQRLLVSRRSSLSAIQALLGIPAEEVCRWETPEGFVPADPDARLHQVGDFMLHNAKAFCEAPAFAIRLLRDPHGLAAKAVAAEKQKAAEEREGKAKEAASVVPAQLQGSGLQLHHLPQLTGYELELQRLRQQLLDLGIQPDTLGPSGTLLQQYHHDHHRHHDHHLQQQQQQRRELSRSRRNSGAPAPELLSEHSRHQEQLSSVTIAESHSGGLHSFGNTGGEGLRSVLANVGEGQPLPAGDLAGLGANGAPGNGTLGRSPVPISSRRGSSRRGSSSRRSSGAALANEVARPHTAPASRAPRDTLPPEALPRDYTPRDETARDGPTRGGEALVPLDLSGSAAADAVTAAMARNVGQSLSRRRHTSHRASQSYEPPAVPVTITGEATANRRNPYSSQSVPVSPVPSYHGSGSSRRTDNGARMYNRLSAPQPSCHSGEMDMDRSNHSSRRGSIPLGGLLDPRTSHTGLDAMRLHEQARVKRQRNSAVSNPFISRSAGEWSNNDGVGSSQVLGTSPGRRHVSLRDLGPPPPPPPNFVLPPLADDHLSLSPPHSEPLWHPHRARTAQPALLFNSNSVVPESRTHQQQQHQNQNSQHPPPHQHQHQESQQEQAEQGQNVKQNTGDATHSAPVMMPLETAMGAGNGGARPMNPGTLQQELELLTSGSHIAVVDERPGMRDAVVAALARRLPRLDLPADRSGGRGGGGGEGRSFRVVHLRFERASFASGLDGFWRWVLAALHSAAPHLFPAANALPSSQAGFQDALSLDRLPSAPPVILICAETCALASASSWFASRFLGALRDLGGGRQSTFLHSVAMVGGAALASVDMQAYSCEASSAPGQSDTPSKAEVRDNLATMVKSRLAGTPASEPQRKQSGDGHSGSQPPVAAPKTAAAAVTAPPADPSAAPELPIASEAAQAQPQPHAPAESGQTASHMPSNWSIGSSATSRWGSSAAPSSTGPPPQQSPEPSAETAVSAQSAERSLRQTDNSAVKTGTTAPDTVLAQISAGQTLSDDNTAIKKNFSKAMAVAVAASSRDGGDKAQVINVQPNGKSDNGLLSRNESGSLFTANTGGSEPATPTKPAPVSRTSSSPTAGRSSGASAPVSPSRGVIGRSPSGSLMGRKPMALPALPPDARRSLRSTSNTSSGGSSSGNSPRLRGALGPDPNSKDPPGLIAHQSLPASHGTTASPNGSPANGDAGTRGRTGMASFQSLSGPSGGSATDTHAAALRGEGAKGSPASVGRLRQSLTQRWKAASRGKS